MRPYLTLHSPSSARRYYEQGLWTDDTFYSLLRRHTDAMPAAKALRDGRALLDWRSLKARVDALADDLLARGVGAGDRVSIWMSNRVEAVIAFLACSRLGAACNPSLHRSYTCAEIVSLLTELKSSVLFAEDGWGADRATQNFDALVSQLPFLKKVYKPENFPLHIMGVHEYAHEDPDTVSYLAFTSGTTGTPKCVMHSCNTLLANARDMVRDWGLSHNEIILTLSPLSHHIAWVAVGQWLSCGGTLVLDGRPSGQSQLDWIIESGATYVMGVPTHAMDILAEQAARGLKSIGSVRTFYMAGAPIPEVVAKAFLDQDITPQNIYGMTENSSHQYTHPDDLPETWTSTCGRGGRAYHVKIWDPDDVDRELPVGETGEIGGRGAALMLGYYGNQQATEQAFNRHGYMLSGDLGSLDEQGNLRIEGRAKDLIIRGGHNIHPSRIEAMALTHPDVKKAAAFPVPDQRLGEKACLAIIGTAEPHALLEHMAARGLSKYDMPEWFISLESLPITASGKILKRALIEQVKSGEIKPAALKFSSKGA